MKTHNLDQSDTSFTAILLNKHLTTGYIFETGASTHMTGCKHDFEKLTPFQEHNVEVANNTCNPTHGVGTARLKLRNRYNHLYTTVLNDVLYTPPFRNTRLFSWNVASKNVLVLEGHRQDLILKDMSGN